MECRRCANCGQPFEAFRPDTLYCTPGCKHAAQERRKYARRRARGWRRDPRLNRWVPEVAA